MKLKGHMRIWGLDYIHFIFVFVYICNYCVDEGIMYEGWI